MTTLPSSTHGALYLAIAQALSQHDPQLAQQMTAEQLADLLADSQEAMDATTPGQVKTIEDMIGLVSRRGTL